MSKAAKPMDGVYRTPNPEMRMVRYYPEGGQERTAIVVCPDKMNRGILDLLVCAGSRLEARRAIRHCEDPFLENMPTARRYGVWDYLEIDRPVRKKSDG